MKRPVFHRTTGFNVIGYKTPFENKPSGFSVDFQPANKEAWILLVGLITFCAFCMFGLPYLVGNELAFGSRTVPTGIFALILSVLFSFGIVFVLSEAPDGGGQS